MKTRTIKLEDLMIPANQNAFVWLATRVGLRGALSMDFDDTLEEINKRVKSFEKARNKLLQKYGTRTGKTVNGVDDYEVLRNIVTKEPDKDDKKKDLTTMKPNPNFTKFRDEEKECLEKEVQIPRFEIKRGDFRKYIANIENVPTINISQLKKLGIIVD